MSVTPVKKGPWKPVPETTARFRTIAACGVQGTQYSNNGKFWCWISGDTVGPTFRYEYQAAQWFVDRVKELAA